MTIIRVALESDILELHSFVKSSGWADSRPRSWYGLDRTTRSGHVIIARREEGGGILAAVRLTLMKKAGDRAAVISRVLILPGALSSKERQHLMSAAARQAAALDAQVVVVRAATRQPYAALRWVEVKERSFDRLPTLVQATLKNTDPDLHGFYKILRKKKT